VKVLDASALLELVVGTSAGLAVADELDDPDDGVHVPHLVDVEVASALRRLVAEGVVSESIARESLDDLQSLDLQRHAHEPMLDRIWELRKNFSAYDAASVALAEVLEAELITCDRRLARAPKLSVRARLITGSRR
jgi:predicted nucleic acid-binding protein